MKRKIFTYSIAEVTPYINWVYFFHAWEFQPRYAGIANLHGCDACRAGWLASFPEEEWAKAAEAMQLHKEALRMLDELDKHFVTKGICRLCEANGDNEDLWLDGIRLPLLRQQEKQPGEKPNLCLSDFVRPLQKGEKDTVGLFAATVSPEMEETYTDDPYKRMLVQTLADRLAEAATERMHEEVRRSYWGYAPDERLTVKELHNEAFQGIRPAVGYPSLPDQSVNFILDNLLDMGEIGIQLTEHGAMRPHASVSGLMLAHPAAHYFAIGHIGEDQLADYAARRGMETDKIRKYLARLLE